MRIIRLNRVNTPNRTHLYYLIDHGVSNKELYSGLAHVTEHACLIDEGSPHFDHFRCGCTCLSHMILYYETKHDLHWMDKIKQRMHDSTLITAENVETAKAEVIAESQLLKAKTRLNEKIVRFVTEDRITEFAMGEPSEIQSVIVYVTQEVPLQRLLDPLIPADADATASAAILQTEAPTVHQQAIIN